MIVAPSTKPTLDDGVELHAVGRRLVGFPSHPCAEESQLNGVRFRISTFLELPTGLQIQLGGQFLDSELMVSGHGFKDAAWMGSGFAFQHAPGSQITDIGHW